VTGPLARTGTNLTTMTLGGLLAITAGAMVLTSSRRSRSDKRRFN
jgi:LPXTG-motif cell wall-anchored protein